jgi:uncharacterized protein YqjF (DUF2071 family)
MPSPLDQTGHRPYPMPSRPWRLHQHWHDLLFAHWPVAPAQITPHLPPGLELDLFDNQAWLGVVPFWMSGVETRLLGSLSAGVPTTRTFSELNLRTYVRSTRTGKPGVFFFSLDCSSPLAVLGARILFHLPYFFAHIQRSQTSGEETHYRAQRQLPNLLKGPGSTRLVPTPTPTFEARFAPTGPIVLSRPGTLEAFLTERYCLYTPHRNRLLIGEIHHHQWPLQPAAAEIRHNHLAQLHSLKLPDTAPILHFSCTLEVFLWSLRPDD